MGSLFDKAMGGGDLYEEAYKVCTKFREEFPQLADIIGGSKGKSGVVDRSPGSVRLFANGGELKAEITGTEWVMRGYLVIPQGVPCFISIEKELAAGRIGWGTKTERKNRYPEPPH